MNWQRIPFIGGPAHISDRTFYTDTDQLFVKVKHGVEFLGNFKTKPRTFVYYIAEKDGHTVAICAKQCTCPDCQAKQNPPAK